MLKELKILNGNLELAFNEYIYEYTVRVDDDINSLEFDYKLSEDSYINIRGNIIDEEENLVYIDVYNVDELITYTFWVYKDNTELVSDIDNFVNTLSISNKEEVSLYKVQILTVSIFLIIVILFSIIFRRKKKRLSK